MFQLSTISLPNWQALTFMVGLVGLWAAIRPSTVRDYDNRRLHNNPTATIMFVAMFVAFYASLVVAFHYSGSLASTAGETFPFVKQLNKAFKNQAPLLAAVTLGAFMQMRFTRDLERAIIIWLHSGRDLCDDRDALRRALASNEFVPIEEERKRYREILWQHGIYVTEPSHIKGPATFANWRKVATLLHLLEGWNTDDQQFLAPNEVSLLHDLKKAHERKTQLATTLVKMVDRVKNGKSQTSALPELVSMLTEVGHLDREEITRIEQSLRERLSEQPTQPSGGQAVHLTGDELFSHLHQIEGYFKVEYQMLIDQVSELAAKSVVLSGEHAAGRLEILKQLGFDGLGKIEPIDLDRILWLFLVVSFGGFAVLFLGNWGEKYSPIGWDALARISFIMSSAALIGAVAGSNRQLARMPSTPWLRYLAYGLMAAIAFFAIQSVSALIKYYQGVEATNRFVFSVYRTIPWVIIPFVITVTIARLARLPAWPSPEKWHPLPPLLERLFDGIALSAMLYFAYVLAIAFHLPLGLPWSKSVTKAMAEAQYIPIPPRWPLQVIGLLIGSVVIRDVRRAAHTSVVIDQNAKRTARSRPPVLSTAGSSHDDGPMFENPTQI